MNATTPNLQPLAALLASHPEECAAVVAVLAISDPCDSLSFAGVMASVDHYAPGAMLEGSAILEIGVAMGWIHVNPWREYGLQPETRYAIARMGAAAWLAARCGAKSIHAPEDHAATVGALEAAFRRGEGVDVTSSREPGAGAPAKGDQR